MNIDNRNDFKIVFELGKKQPWLNEVPDELMSLLYSDCTTEKQRRLIIDLLDRFNHLSNSEYREGINKLVDRIILDSRFDVTNTQLVAMAADRKPDSSQYMIYDLKPLFEKKKWRGHKMVNRYDKCYNTYKSDKNFRNIILIDEFIGSGSTAIQRVETIQRSFHQANAIKPLIIIKAIVATKQGLKAISSEGIEVESLITIDKGISDHFNEDEKNKNLALMGELEELLSDKYDDDELPKLGYGKTESLYCREFGNTPNNVFPIFWWPFYKDNNDREPILTRAMGD